MRVVYDFNAIVIQSLCKLCITLFFPDHILHKSGETMILFFTVVSFDIYD